MRDEKWFAASLRISGDTLQPEDIDRILGLKPTRIHRRGEPRGRHGKSAETHWSHSLWSLESPLGEGRDLAEHLKWLLDALEPRVSVLKKLAEQYRIDLFCGFSSRSGQGGLVLDAAILRRLAGLGIPITLDLYPPGQPDADE